MSILLLGEGIAAGERGLIVPGEPHEVLRGRDTGKLKL